MSKYNISTTSLYPGTCKDGRQAFVDATLWRTREDALQYSLDSTVTIKARPASAMSNSDLATVPLGANL
jgi:hypothetical protein